MSRHIKWWIIIPLAALIVIAGSSSLWIDYVKPNDGDDANTVRFECPAGIGGDEREEVCRLLQEMDERDAIEAEAMINAILSGSVNAPADEVDEDSMLEDIDLVAVSELIQTRIRVGRFTEIDMLHWATGPD